MFVPAKTTQPMTSKTINVAMIILARESRGWSQAELAEKISLSPANLSKIERAEIGIQDDTVFRIADATGYPFQFFTQLGDILPPNLNYRKRVNVAQKIITPIEARCNIIQRHVQFLTRALKKEAPKIPILESSGGGQSVNKIVQQLRKKWKIATPVIPDLVHLIESNGIMVVQFDFGTERVDSRSILTEDKYPIIILNSSLLGDRQRFTAAYELGHMVMHTFTTVPADRDISKEANQFAAELLMPEKEIRQDFKAGITIPVLGELKRKWKVSMISLLYRADDLGLLTPNQKRYLVQQFNQLKIRRREPVELDIPAEQPRLMRQFLSEYRAKKKLGVMEISALLALEVGEYIELYS